MSLLRACLIGSLKESLVRSLKSFVLSTNVHIEYDVNQSLTLSSPSMPMSFDSQEMELKRYSVRIFQKQALGSGRWMSTSNGVMLSLADAHSFYSAGTQTTPDFRVAQDVACA